MSFFAPALLPSHKAHLFHHALRSTCISHSLDAACCVLVPCYQVSWKPSLVLLGRAALRAENTLSYLVSGALCPWSIRAEDGTAWVIYRE